MSRIILTEYPTGQERVVVGWDHPCKGAFWQEFNEEPEGEIPDDWQEVLRDGGFLPGIPLDRLREDMPEDLRPLITDTVMELLQAHSEDPDSGYRKHAINLSQG